MCWTSPIEALLRIGLRLRNWTVLQKARNDSTACLLQRSFSVKAAVIEHVTHELSDHAIFFLLPKCPQPLRLRPASVVVTRVVNITARAVDDELSKASIGEVQHIPAAHSEELFKFVLF